MQKLPSMHMPEELSKEINYILILLASVVIKRMFNIDAILFVLGGMIGFELFRIEKTIDNAFPLHENVGREKHTLFRSPIVIGAYIVFSSAFLITNRTVLANGIVLGVGARYLTDALYLFKYPEQLRQQFFWMFSLSKQAMQACIYGAIGLYILFTLLA